MSTILTIHLPDGVDSYEVTETLHDMYNAHDLNHADFGEAPSSLEWDYERDVDLNRPTLPFDQEAARTTMDENGSITVVVEVDQDEFMNNRAYGASGGYSEADTAHSAAFDFGLPEDCEAEVIGVSGSNFIVRYTTRIINQLDDPEKD